MKRLVRIIGIIVILITFYMIIVNLIIDWLDGCDAKMQVKDYMVKENDTLWQIASEYKPKEMSYDQYLYEMRKVNDKNLSVIYRGEIINILIEE